MIRALALLAIVACSKAEIEDVSATRAAVRAAHATKARRDRAAIDGRLADLQAQLRAAPDDITRVRISTALDELLVAARTLGEDTLAESARINVLPDRCFVKPFPDDCRLR